MAPITRHSKQARRRVRRARRVPVICGICGDRIDMSLRAPDPGSFSVDHKVPLALGGTDGPPNLQPAHLGCNKSKGARPTLAEILGG